MSMGNMLKSFVAVSHLVAFVAMACGAEDPLDSVRATTGTINSFALSAGNVYPAICRPWGGPMWAPVTKPGHSEGWFYGLFTTMRKQESLKTPAKCQG